MRTATAKSAGDACALFGVSRRKHACIRRSFVRCAMPGTRFARNCATHEKEMDLDGNKWIHTYIHTVYK